MKKNIKPVIPAIASAICIGAGQIINGQLIKGIAYIIVYILLILFGIPYMLFGIEDLITLGTVPMYQHSLFIMTYGILSILALIYVIIFYIFNIIDAYKRAKLNSQGIEMPSFTKSVKEFLRKKGSIPNFV